LFYLEVSKAREVGRKVLAKIVVGDITKLQKGEGHNLIRQVASEVVLVDRYVDQVFELSQVV
jgi:hypothetical protein